MNEIDVETYNERLKAGNAPFLLDVREAQEHDFVNISGKLIPLGEIQTRASELDAYKSEEVVVYCRSGARSATACRILEAAGFENVWNLKGGIMEWSRKIDPTKPMY